LSSIVIIILEISVESHITHFDIEAEVTIGLGIFHLLNFFFSLVVSSSGKEGNIFKMFGISDCFG